eukprot:Hpha_TRINITY_DN3683_c0_g1::TRINITY_DN3683_c0_g1_i1::g.942::m.942
MVVVSPVLLTAGLMFTPALSTTAAAAVGCDVEEELPAVLHPLGLSVADSHYVGCIVCGVGAVAVASMVGMLTTSKFRGDGVSASLGLGFSMFLHPNLAFSLFMFLYQGIAIAAARLCLASPPPLESQTSIFIGCLTLFSLLFLPLGISRVIKAAVHPDSGGLRTCREPRAVLLEWDAPVPTGLLRVLIGGVGDWTSTNSVDDWLVKWQVAVRRFTAAKVHQGLLTELTLMLAAGVLLSASPKDLLMCGHFRVATATLHAAYVCQVIAKGWYRAPLDHWASAFRLSLLVVTFTSQALVYYGVLKDSMVIVCKVSFLAVVIVVFVHATSTVVGQIFPGRKHRVVEKQESLLDPV